MTFLFIFFSLVLLYLLPLIHSTTYNMSMPICPASFSCPDSGPFSYPFYNGNDTRCGLIEVNCTLNHENIQLGGRSYVITTKLDSGPSVFIENRSFEDLLEAENCKALVDNFTSPTPELFSISIKPLITLFKCTNDPKYVPEIDAYFNQPTYNSYNKCINHKFYYKHHMGNYTTAPSDLPPRCEVIQLPGLQIINEAKAAAVTLSKESFSVQMPITVILVLALSVGAVTILIIIMLCFRRKLRWRTMSMNNVNVEMFLKNHEFIAPKRYSYSQVQKMTNLLEIQIKFVLII
ncbi:putative LEAF RUST 10 DISEASE-RESISTANCE LOCUS RECEPTOR-LIKE PROTEIN KINASE-like 1.1/1.2/1.3/1.4 [Helianthus debilis subsp. tardiflorus]